jgi:hypothetical protein
MGMHKLLLVSVSLNYKKSNLEGVAKKILGNKGRYFILVLLVLAQMSVFIGANLFIGKSEGDLISKLSSLNICSASTCELSFVTPKTCTCSSHSCSRS